MIHQGRVMNELALFAGAGGGVLAGKLLGWNCVGAVEIDRYCRRVLLRRQKEGYLPRFPIWDDVRHFDGRPWRGLIDVLSGGFPCQGISSAGKGLGVRADPRSGLWSEFGRLIGEIRPAFAFIENSPLLVSRGLDVVLGDLAAMGYDARWCVLGAGHVGAPHQRDRIWILAYSSRGDARQPLVGEAGRERPDRPGQRGGLRDESRGRGPHPRDDGSKDQGADADRQPKSQRGQRPSVSARRGGRQDDRGGSGGDPREICVGGTGGRCPRNSQRQRPTLRDGRASAWWTRTETRPSTPTRGCTTRTREGWCRR